MTSEQDRSLVVVIPAYQPTDALIRLVQQLVSQVATIIVVDDGSSPERMKIFDELVHLPRVHVLRHAVNLGKGQALKTAFNYFLLNFPTTHVGVVTADADGQHLAQDVVNVGAALSATPTDLILGRRELCGAVPWKSAVGNKLTRQVFHTVLGRRIEDTQTGLRGIPRSLLRDLLRVSASGYEFELEMLAIAVKENRRIREVTIETVYENENRGTHFNPVRDSLKIYFVFLRFALLSLITAALDFAVFFVAHTASSNILLSTVVARVAAGFFNFHFARAAVFKSHGSRTAEILKYVGLVFWLMAISYTLLTGLVIFLGLSVYVSKVIAETTLFIANFAIQRLLVFVRPEPDLTEPSCTDWDAYYRRPAATARVTRRITTRLLLDMLRRHALPGVQTIWELGGANSSFYSAMRAAFPTARYVVVDNNALGLSLLRERVGNEDLLETRNENVLELSAGIRQADIVYSVGLIEHFSPSERAIAIKTHFDCVRPDGLVVITFPTPTWLYRVTRYLAEQLGVWQFPDERPLQFEEVESEVSKYGTLLESRINWPIVLTQGVVVVRSC